MSEQDRTTMVRGMVERLANRLKQNADDVEGWQRLLRAYVVLNERDKAQAAVGEARRAFASDPGKLRQIEDTIKSLGLQS
jgi:cytochrome c-type biogenesis protein CcmH